MNKIKQLTAHLRLMHQRGQIITDSDDFATALNQIDIASESQPLLDNKAVDEWIEIKKQKDPNISNLTLNHLKTKNKTESSDK